MALNLAFFFHLCPQCKVGHIERFHKAACCFMYSLVDDENRRQKRTQPIRFTKNIQHIHLAKTPARWTLEFLLNLRLHLHLALHASLVLWNRFGQVIHALLQLLRVRLAIADELLEHLFLRLALFLFFQLSFSGLW